MNSASEPRVAQDAPSVGQLLVGERRVFLVHHVYLEGPALFAVLGFVIDTLNSCSALADGNDELARVALETPSVFVVVDAQMAFEALNAEVDSEFLAFLSEGNFGGETELLVLDLGSVEHDVEKSLHRSN
jgi:hypothetical protein